MTRLHQRMIGVDALSEPELSPADKRLLYIGVMMLADDAGCLRWDAVTVRGNLFPYGDVTLERALTLMTELELDEYVWPYEGADGRQYAYLRDFPIWQKSRTRQYRPEVPLPPGITFRPAENRPNAGSGSYTYPENREDFEGSNTEEPQDQNSQGNSTQGNSTQDHVIALKGPAQRPDERPDERPADGGDERPAEQHSLPPSVQAWSREKFGGSR